MEASKQDVLDALIPVLRMTRIGFNIAYLEYKDGYVIVHWSNGAESYINVDCCSNLSMIQQVCGGLL